MRTQKTTILDLGASRLALGDFSRRGRQLRMDAFTEESLAQRSGAGWDWLAQTQAALKALGARVGRSSVVVLVLPPHLVLTKLVKVPRVEPAKSEKIIRFAAEQGIPYALDDVVWGNVVASEQGSDRDVLIAAAKREAVETLCAAAQAAGFEPRFVLPSPLATLAGFRLVQPASAEPMLVLNLGARSTTFLHVEGGRFVVRPMALGTGVPGGMEALVTRLGQEVARFVLHFRRQGGLANPGRVWLTGGASGQAGLVDALALKLKMPVGRLDVLGAVEIGEAASRNDIAAHAPALADLVGAAATQLLPEQTVLDLLPPRLRQHEARRRRQPWLAVAAVLTMAALLPPLWHFRAVAAEAARKTAAIEQELGPLREREARNRTRLEKLGELRRQIAQLQGVHDRRAWWVGFFGDLQERLAKVEDVWLERFAVASAPGAPLRFSVSGRMLDKTNPLSKVSPETFIRVKTLLASIADSPFVAAVEDERFDHGQPGMLKFGCVLVADPARPL